MGSPGFNSHGALVWLAVPLGSALFRAVGRGWQTVILRDPSSSYRFGKSFFQSLKWKCPSCCEKGLRGEKICTVWCFGSTHHLSLLRNALCGQRLQLCWVGICGLVLLPLSQQHLWAQRGRVCGGSGGTVAKRQRHDCKKQLCPGFARR